MIAEQPGELSVLNCGKGDIRISFDKDDPQEAARARRIIEDMLQRGYIIFVETKKGLRKVLRFNRQTDCYIIADGPMYAGDTIDEPSPETAKMSGKKSIPMQKARATGIAPTAGG